MIGASEQSGAIFILSIENKKVIKYVPCRLKMGCLKLTYRPTELQLKGVYRKPNADENIALRFLSVDPMAEEREWLSPYNFAQQNPVNRVDPLGMLDDWYTDASGELVNDENITSQADLDAAGIEGTYQGSEGWAINETTGDYTHYRSDGTTTDVPHMLDEVTVTTNPITDAIYQGQKDFVNHPVTQGAFNLATAFIPVGVIGKGLGYVGKYGRAALKGVTTADGFLFGGITMKAPVTIGVQRFGNMSLSRPDYWGAKIGTSQFANRTFAAIKPGWNPLTQYTTGVIPKGTSIKVGIIGPQGIKYPGGSMQVITNSKNVINQSSKIIKR